MDPTQRFSDRVANYIKYRPGYPPEVMTLFVNELGLTPEWRVADIGSGTGISTALFLDHGNTVFAVEPNDVMREAAESLLGGRANFRSVRGTAEATTLDDASVDFVVAGQAFHWFDAGRTRTEFLRILRPGGYVALMWNDRDVDTTPFLRGYETLLLERGLDYAAVDHKNVSAEKLAAFFGTGGYRDAVFENAQYFDWDGLYGRAMSASYVPPEGHAGHAAFTDELRVLFDAHETHGTTAFTYKTRVRYGHLSG